MVLALCATSLAGDCVCGFFCLLFHIVLNVESSKQIEGTRTFVGSGMCDDVLEGSYGLISAYRTLLHSSPPSTEYSSTRVKYLYSYSGVPVVINGLKALRDFLENAKDAPTTEDVDSENVGEPHWFLPRQSLFPFFNYLFLLSLI
jgi:hypothetical protein